MTILLAADISGSHGLCPPGGQDADGNVQVGSQMLMLMKDGNMEDGGVTRAIEVLLSFEGKPITNTPVAFSSTVHEGTEVLILGLAFNFAKDKTETLFYVGKHVDEHTITIPELQRLYQMQASTEKSMLQLALVCVARLGCKLYTCEKSNISSSRVGDT